METIQFSPQPRRKKHAASDSRPSDNSTITNMYLMKLCLIIHFLHFCHCDWVKEWMSSIRSNLRAPTPYVPDPYEDINEYIKPQQDIDVYSKNADEDRTENLKTKLHNTLQMAKGLSNSLTEQIITLTKRETRLKEAITNGRDGITTVKVSTLNHRPKQYIVRDGKWTLCKGQLQFPVRSRSSPSLFSEIFTQPRCIGNEIQTRRDPCVFNSIIKYETVPVRRQEVYKEDSFFCLKPNFNSSLEQFLSVPRAIVNDTCKHGISRSLEENSEQCSSRTMSEYNYYPHKSSAAAGLPLEYCTESGGFCKLVVAWHISNISIEYFEFLKDEPKFQQYFIKYEPNLLLD